MWGRGGAMSSHGLCAPHVVGAAIAARGLFARLHVVRTGCGAPVAAVGGVVVLHRACDRWQVVQRVAGLTRMRQQRELCHLTVSLQVAATTSHTHVSGTASIRTSCSNTHPSRLRSSMSAPTIKSAHSSDARKKSMK